MEFEESEAGEMSGMIGVKDRVRMSGDDGRSG